MEGLLATAPTQLPFSFVVVDDQSQALCSSLQTALPTLPLRSLPAGAEPSPENISNLLSEGCDFLLVNAHIDPSLPGGYLRELLRRYGGKAPFRLFVFAASPFFDALSPDLPRRGVEAVLPLDQSGIERLKGLLATLWQRPAVFGDRPIIRPEPSLKLSEIEQDLLHLLFVEDEEVFVQEIRVGAIPVGTGAASRRLRVETGEGRDKRRFFVKIGRWDSLTEEYAHYVNLVQGKHENYAGRVIGLPVIRGATAALRFSLAGPGDKEPQSLRQFLSRSEVNLMQGVSLLRNLKRRLVASPNLDRRDFEPRKFLRVLPAALTLTLREFGLQQGTKPLISTGGSRESTSVAPEIQDDLQSEPLPFSLETISDPKEFRSFLTVAQQWEGNVAEVKGLVIQEMRLDDENHTILQLSDLGAGGEDTGCKINIEVADAALFSSLKLHRGKALSVIGTVQKTLLDIIEKCRPSLDLNQWALPAPEGKLYDLLFGQWRAAPDDPGEKEWKESPLHNLHDVPIGDFIHGDFNLGNILVEEWQDEAGEASIPWLIDFEKSSTGLYPAFDWAKLEVEIAIHLTREDLFSEDNEPDRLERIVQLEHSLVLPRSFDGELWVPATSQRIAGKDSLERVFLLQGAIRRLAADGLASLTFTDYLFAVMCYSLQALRYAPDPLGKYVAYIKAAVACKRIYQILPKENEEETEELR